MFCMQRYASSCPLKKPSIFLLLFTFPFSFTGWSQSISLNMDNVSIEKAFIQIEKQSEYSFVYTREQIKLAQPVTVHLRNITLKEALNACFREQPLGYVIESKHIIVQNKIPVEDNGGSPLTHIISGRVTGDDDVPVMGVSVNIKGSDIYSVTDKNGSFKFVDAHSKTVLIFTHIAYQEQEYKCNNCKSFVVHLLPKISSLNETLIMAYGTTTKKLNTGNITRVSGEDISKQPVSNPLAALEGRVPGMVITQTSGIPGAAFKVEIRGRTALDFNISKNDPLYIIDGVPFEMGSTSFNLITSAANNPTSTSEGGFSALNMINPQDIESIEVLKDADATAIYGSRGANGVVLITTKSGLNQKMSVSLNLSTGISKVTRLMDLLNTSQYVAMRKEALANDQITPTINNAPDIMLWDTTQYTDIQKILAGGTAKYNDALLSLSGGNQQTSFLIGAAFHKETTVLPGDFSNTRFAVNSAINHTSPNKRFSLNFKTIYSIEENHIISYDPSQYFYLPPNIILYDSTGTIAWQQNGVPFSSINNFTNPLSLLREKYQSDNNNLSTNLYIKFELLKGLFLQSSFGYNVFQTDESSQNPSSSIDPASALLPSAMFGNSISKSWIIEPQLEYRLSLQKSKFNFLLGSTFQNRTYKGTSISGENYADDLLLSSIAAAGNINATNFFNQYRYTALFGRLNYALSEKYLLNLTARRDGSSRFGPGQRFSNFGAIGGAWIFSSEKFFRQKMKWLSFGKIRSSYGISGNDQIGDYKFYDLWRNTSAPYQGVSGLFPVGLFNPDYEWERNRKFEIAGEFGFLKERISLTVAYYRHRSSNQLVNYNLPKITGFTSIVKNLPALVQNSGLELSAIAHLINASVSKYTTSFNLTIPKNKLISFPNLSQSSYYSIYVEGQPLSVIRRYKFLGVDPQTGVYTFEDVNKDGAFTSADDYQILGDLDPDFDGGWQNNITFKDFEIDFFVQFVKQMGDNYLSSVSRYLPGYILNQPDIVLDHWTTPGEVKPIQKYTTSSATPAGQAAIRYLGLSNGIYSDASYIRLKTVSLSYQPRLKFLGLKNKLRPRFFVNGQNLITVTKYKGADPETQSYFQLPPMKTVVFGIQLNF